MEILFVLVPLFIGGVFLFVIGGLLVTTIRNLSQPVLNRAATVVAKRQDFRHHSGHHHVGTTGRTYYYITFEFEDGRREEFSVNGGDYGVIVEGDFGSLRSRGSWFQGFTRAGKR